MQRTGEMRPDLPVALGAPPALEKGPRPEHVRFVCSRTSRKVPA